MFCPRCGSNQSDGKKFCTVCGTNLFLVSQALTGQLTPPQPIVHHLPPVAYQPEFDRHRDTRKGITMAVLGGSYLVYQIINFLFSAPFTGWRTPFGVSSFIAFIVCAVGISKIISSRVIAETLPTSSSAVNAYVAPRAPTQSQVHASAKLPTPVFSAATSVEPSAPHTNELEPVQSAISVTEEETRHLKR